MLRLLTVFAWLMGAGLAQAFGPLIGPDAVPGDGNTLILDIRSPDDYAAGHIPGAINTPYGVFRGPRENPGRVPDLADLQQVLRSAGAASTDQPVLVVHAGENPTDFGAAARVYWTLKSMGFAELAILNGGFNGWSAAGGAPSTEASTPVPTMLTVSFDDSWMMDTDAVRAVAAGESAAVLLDARPAEFFRGETKHGAASAAGTLRGALNIVHATWFSSGGPVLDAPEAMLTEIRNVAASAGPDAPLVSFCNTGHWAATNWFAASELAGIEGVKLYPESMVGWTLFGGAVVDGTK